MKEYNKHQCLSDHARKCGSKRKLVSDTNDLIVLIIDTTELDEKIAKLQTEQDVINEFVNKLMRENFIKT